MPRIEQWHVWHIDPKTKGRKWMGQFYDDKSALTWVKTKGEHRPEYIINNIGPDIGKVTTRQMSSQEMDRRKAQRAEDRRRQQERYNAVKAGKIESSPPKRKKTADEQMLADLAEGLLEDHKADEKADLDKGINR